VNVLPFIVLIRCLFEGINDLVVLDFLHLRLLLLLLDLFCHEGYFLEEDGLLFGLLMTAQVRSNTHIVGLLPVVLQD